MSARLVAPAPHPGAPLFAGWLIGPALDAQIRAALPGCAIVLDSSRDLAPSLARTRGLAPSATGPLILGGWSAGCQTVRKLLVDGVQADVVITLDGTHADLHPAAWQLDVWRKLADRARRGECLWLATATQQVYVEGLVDNPATPAREVPYRASVHVLEDVLGRKLPPGTKVHEGGLHVWSSPSALIDGAAHMREANRMPELLRTYVAPWISVHHPNTDNTLRRGARGDAVRAWQVALGLAGFRTDADSDFGPRTEDATKRAQLAAHLPVTGVVDDATRDAVATLTRDTQPGPELPTLRRVTALGLAMVDAYRDAIALPVIETPADSNRGPWIDDAMRLVGLDNSKARLNWCAGCWTKCGRIAERATGMRLPVAGGPGARAIRDQLRAIGHWRDRSAGLVGFVEPGMTLVWDRSDGVPEHAWWAHIGVAASSDIDGQVATYEGNSGPRGDRMAELRRSLSDSRLLGVGWV